MVAAVGGHTVGAGALQLAASRPPVPVVQSESGR